MEDVHLTKKGHDERGFRTLDDGIRCAVLLDLSLIHDHDAVGQLECFLLVVRDKHARHLDSAVQTPEPAPQFLSHLRVEGTERLVEQQHLGLDCERPRQSDALPLSAGELGRIPIPEVIKLHQRQ